MLTVNETLIRQKKVCKEISWGILLKLPKNLSLNISIQKYTWQSYTSVSIT